MTNELTRGLIASHVDLSDGPWWWVLSWSLFPLLLTVLACVAIWLMTRAPNLRRRAVGPGSEWATSSADPALEHVRLRYARGEIDHDEFLRLSGELQN